MSELLIGTAALPVAAPVVLAVARLVLWTPMRQTGLFGNVLLVASVTAYALTLLHLIAREVQRVRWRREFDGWRIIQRERITRRANW